MNPTRSALAAAVVLAGISACGVAGAETLPAKHAQAAAAKTSSEPSTVSQVETWTQKQWNTAKKEWAKDKAKWAGCQKKSDTQKLSGRKSWSFLYQCMTG